MSDLRPTLFLAQLSNLLAGNIAIVHGVCGTSRTFMGEEAAGVDAARIALARIAAGQSDIALIGGSHNGERKDLLVLYEFGDYNLKDKFAPVWARQRAARLRARLGRRVPGDRIQGACGGARRKALCAPDQRGRRPRRRKQPGDVTATLEELWSKLGTARRTAARSSPARPAPSPSTSEERAFLEQACGLLPCAPPARRFGHTMETQFPLGLGARGACRSRAARCFRPAIPPAFEIEMSQAADPDCRRGRRPLAGRRHGAGRSDQVSTTRTAGKP